jgi:ubiquinone/menaquinone biosynthesis C-methylase UbiE
VRSAKSAKVYACPYDIILDCCRQNAIIEYVMQEPWYYDVVAPVYDIIVPRDVKGICDSLEEILKRHIKSKGIVDLVCGTGRFAIKLAKHKYRICGIDLSEEMLNVARKKAERASVRIRFMKADMRNFTLPKKAGIIWARGSIGDLIRRADQQKALLNIHRNLSRNGLLVLDVRDYDQHFQLHKKSTVHDTRVFKQRYRKITFRFVLDLNKKSRIATIKGEVLVNGPHRFETIMTRHALQYFAKQGLANLLAAAGFGVLEIMPGYHVEKGMKPRLLAVAQPRGQA